MKQLRWVRPVSLVALAAGLLAGSHGFTPAPAGPATLLHAAGAPGTAAGHASLQPCEPVQVFTPPAGFRPLTATASQLAADGFPPRPPASEPVLLAVWTRAMKSLRHLSAPAPCGTLALQHNSNVYSDNWAGHVVPKADYGDQVFTAVTAEWVQPKVAADPNYTCDQNSCNAPAVAAWTGIGISDMLQAGCDSISATTPVYVCWTEDYPQGAVTTGLPVHPGDTMYVYVHYLGNNQTSYYLDNVSTGMAVGPFTKNTPDVGSNAANFVVERIKNTAGQASGYYLPQFSTIPFYGNAFFQGSTEHELTTNDNPWFMMDGCTSADKELANPGTVSNTDFTVTWKASRPWTNSC